MARKETITKNDLLDAAFKMVQQEGIEEVTARKVANRAGCSTQPIFRIYSNMDELIGDLFHLATDFFEDYYNHYEKKTITPFVNLGMAYISFASEEKNLFRFLFLSETRYGKSLYELVNGNNAAVAKEVNAAKQNGCLDPSEMFMKMWIFIHGAACMTLTGDYDLSEEETLTLLKDSYTSFRN